MCSEWAHNRYFLLCVMFPQNPKQIAFYGLSNLGTWLKIMSCYDEITHKIMNAKEFLQASSHMPSKVLLLVNRNPQTGSKPNYCVKSHLSACWSGKNASSSIDLTAALPSGSPLHHPNHPLSTISTGAWDPNWICPKKMTQIIPTIAPTICCHTWRLLRDFSNFQITSRVGKTEWQ